MAEDTKSQGIGFCGLLTIAFIVLKLCKVIDWSWLWVLAPFWIPLAILLVVLLFIGVVIIIGLIIEYFKTKIYLKSTRSNLDKLKEGK